MGKAPGRRSTESRHGELHSLTSACIALRGTFQMQDSLGERFGLQLYPGATSFLILPRKAGRAIAVAHILQSNDFSDVTVDDPAYDQAIELEAEGENVEAARVREQMEDSAIRGRDGETATDLTEDRDKALHRDVSKAEASKKLLESYDYVLS